MIWFIFALLGAIFDITYYASIKKLLKNINQYIFSSGVFLSTFLILIFISLIKGFPKIGDAFYYSVLASAFLNILAAILYYKALRITGLSLSMPMISFTPVFLIFTSFVLLREFPTIFGIFGIFLIVLGSYILNLTRNSRGFLDPFKEIFRNKGTLYMLVVAFLYSFSANFDKLVVQNSDPIFGSSIVALLLASSFLVISFSKAKDIKLTYKKNFHRFFFVGAVLALGAIVVNIAYTLQIVPYVISIKRLSILFSVFCGGLIFKEKNILKRSTGALIMLIGAILIVLF